MTSAQRAGPVGEVDAVVGPEPAHPQSNGYESAGQRAGMTALISLAKAVADTGPFSFDGTVIAPELWEARQPAPTAAARSGGRHRALGERHGVRFLVFGAIGASVFVVGLGLQIALVRFLQLGAVAAYIIQGVASIQLSFLLNRYLTWRDRSVPFTRALWRFNTQKAVATVFNLTAYALLIRLGVEYVVANIGLTAVFTPLNYVATHYWSFKPRAVGVTTAPQIPGRAARDLLPPGPLPTVGVVIPCKNNPQTIRATVDAMLLQDYPALDEIILVGDIGDPTWSALTGITDQRISILEHEPANGRRDPNIKRDKGIHKSRSDLLALVDSDIVMETDWLSWAVVMLLEQGGGLVAGGMRSIQDTFWGRFVDRNALAAKTPRLPRPYFVTAKNFGKRGFKPPITANAVFTRQLYEACPLDVTWDYGYEDYEWFWRLTKAGHKILFSGRLTAAHHHRTSFQLLAREYQRSARGCAEFIRAHRECPLARKRLRQATLLPLGALAGLAALVIAARSGHLADAGVFLGVAAALLVIREIGTARSVEAAVYPAFGLALGVMFTGSLLSSLTRTTVAQGGGVTADERTVQGGAQPVVPRSAGHRRRWPLAAILCVQAGLSLSLVWSNTAFSQEANYLLQGRLEWAHWLHGSAIPAFTGAGASQIYPPLGALADGIAGLAGARILSLCFMLAATALLYHTARPLFGEVAAVIGAALWAISEPVLRLAFATADPLACLLVALSAYVAVQAGVRRRQGELVAVAAVLLALASATAFAFAVMVPAVVAFAFLAWQSLLGTRLAVWCAAWLAGTTTVLVVGLFTFLHLWADALHSTFTRAKTTSGADLISVVRSVWSWDGLIITLAAVGAVAAFAGASNLNRRLLILALFTSAMLIPVYQAAIGTGSWLLDQRMSAGTWLLAMGAGYAVATLAPLSRWRVATSVATVAFFLMYPVVSGTWYARSTFRMWPNVGTLVARVRPIINSDPGPVLVTTTNSAETILEYYLLRGHDWQRWQPTTSKMKGVSTGKFTFAVLELNGSFNSAALTEGATHNARSALARKILQLATASGELASAARELEHSPYYRIRLIIPYSTSNAASSTGIFVVWQHVAAGAS